MAEFRVSLIRAPRIGGPAAATAAILALTGCAGGPTLRPKATTSLRPHGYVGCRSRACTGGDPRHRQYFEQRRSRYYWFDPVRKHYYWEDGSPYP